MAKMLHSELTKMLLATRSIAIDAIPKHIENIIWISGKEGVQKEGGDELEGLWAGDKNAGTVAPTQGNGAAGALSVARPGTGFVWGKSSLNELKGVDPRLVECATLALTKYSLQDYRCYDGLRTPAEQAKHVKAGNSRTMQSKHLDGLAVDLVPVIGGILKWDWNGCYKIAYAMDQAATELGIAHLITWGGAWDRKLSDFGGNERAYQAEVEAYKIRHSGSDFIDGPHFEILKG